MFGWWCVYVYFFSSSSSFLPHHLSPSHNDRNKDHNKGDDIVDVGDNVDGFVDGVDGDRGIDGDKGTDGNKHDKHGSYKSSDSEDERRALNNLIENYDIVRR